jgi:hypothetical protein
MDEETTLVLEEINLHLTRALEATEELASGPFPGEDLARMQLLIARAGSIVAGAQHRLDVDEDRLLDSDPLYTERGDLQG